MSACTVAPPQRLPEGPARVEPLAAAPGAGGVDGADAEQEDASLPNVPLTKELLYKLMRAEFDFRAGNWQAPYLTMMTLAQQTRDPRLAQRAAEMAMLARQAGESLVAVRLWRELAPDSEEAAQYYLGLAVMADSLDEAERIFAARLQEASPKERGMAMIQVQQYLARARDKEAASVLLDKLLAPYAETFEARVLLAQNAFSRGESASALALAQSALAMKPDSEVAILTLAQVTSDQAQVGPLLARFLAAHPGAREVRTAYARVLVGQKQYEPARREFAALLAQQPGNLGTLYALGLVSMQMRDAPAAEKYFAQYIDQLEKSPDEEREPGKVLMILAELAESRGDLKGAEARLAQVGEGDRATHFSAQIRRGQLLARQGDVDGAQAFLAALRPDDAASQALVAQAQAQVLREAGRLQEAYTVLSEAATRHPANADLLYDFALMAEKTGRLEIMEKTLRSVMAQAPDNHHAYNALGYSLAERNVRLQEALALIGKAMQLAPEDPFIMDSMGWVQYRLGNLDQAEAHLRRAYSLRKDADIAVHLGEVLWHKGMKADAHKLWREARAKDPKSDILRSTLARLHQSL